MRAHPLIVALVLYIGALAILWLLDTSLARDPGHYAETLQGYLKGFYRWPYDKAYHGGAALVLGIATAYQLAKAGVAHPRSWAVAFVMLGGLGIELIEWRPRHPYPNNRRGRFSTWDLATDLLGAMLGALVGGAL